MKNLIKFYLIISEWIGLNSVFEQERSFSSLILKKDIN